MENARPNDPAGPTQQPDLAERLVQAINDSLRRSDSLYHDVARRIGVGDCAFDILYNLMEEDGLTQTELVARGFSNKQTVSSSVKRLQEDGLVAPCGDGRTVRICLTDAGKRLVEGKIRPIRQAERDTVGVFSPIEQERILNCLGRYTNELSERLTGLDL